MIIYSRTLTKLNCRSNKDKINNDITMKRKCQCVFTVPPWAGTGIRESFHSCREVTLPPGLSELERERKGDLLPSQPSLEIFPAGSSLSRLPLLPAGPWSLKYRVPHSWWPWGSSSGAGGKASRAQEASDVNFVFSGLRRTQKKNKDLKSPELS